MYARAREERGDVLARENHRNRRCARSAWFGLFAPRNPPAEIIDKLNKEINAALADPNVKARLADLGGKVVPGSPADFGTLVVDDKEKWAKVIRAAGIKAE